MANYRSRAPRRPTRSRRVNSYSRTPKRAVSARTARTSGRSRQQTVRVVIQQAPATPVGQSGTFINEGGQLMQPVRMRKAQF